MVGMPNNVHKKNISRGIGTFLIGVLCLLSLSACRDNNNPHTQYIDKLNETAYAFRYKNLDSTFFYAKKAYDNSQNYGDGKAEALNNMAFVFIANMEYEKADSLLMTVATHTTNQVELLVADIQMMRLCQRMSANRLFYDFQENAISRRRRIMEEPSALTPHLTKRMVYAESEMEIVVSTYYYYIGQHNRSANAIERINKSIIASDTAQYLNYIYNIGSGGILRKKSPEDIRQREFELLVECYITARKTGNVYFEANALGAISEHLLDTIGRRQLVGNNPAAMKLINPENLPDSIVARQLAIQELDLFKKYGDKYQIAGAHRTLASAYMQAGNYQYALDHLYAALADTIVNKAPALVASVREQMSVAFSAIDDKVSSDYSRNIYLDIQDDTRQDRMFESRADMLRKSEHQLNLLLAIVVATIILIITMLWWFNRLYQKRNKTEENRRLLDPLQQWSKRNKDKNKETEERYEEITEKMAVVNSTLEKNSERNIEQRARISLAISLLPLIDRIINEVRMLHSRKEDDSVVEFRKEYIAELINKINQTNDTLTRWIKLTEGQLSLKPVSFRLQELFDIISKNKNTFAAKGVDLVVRPTSATLKADRILTLFMINTLADNARKFTPEGGRVEVSAKEDNGCVEVSVSDTGCGLTESEMASVFDRKVSNGHGFGLMNCRGIIEKYRKTSSRFACATIGVESQKGRGSRFFFRLPKGVAKTLAALFALAMPSMLIYATADHADMSTNMQVDHSQLAASFADSAYYANIDGQYRKTLEYADSCLYHLNQRYLQLRPNGKDLLKKISDNTLDIADTRWLSDTLSIDFTVIVDIRNETAVAALALHEWELYRYNNTAFTKLYNLLSADNTIADYCAKMRTSQTNKTVAIIFLVMLLLAIPPAYYMLYYRHRLYFRYCEELISGLYAELNSPSSLETKLKQAEKLAGSDLPQQLAEVVDIIRRTVAEALEVRKDKEELIEQATDRLNKTEYESNNLYVSNSILDNCLSTLKHETMYYPGRIKQMMERETCACQMGDTLEVVEYYKNVYSMLCSQAASQIRTTSFAMRHTPVSQLLQDYHVTGDTTAVVICNEYLILRLLHVVEGLSAGGIKQVEVNVTKSGYALFIIRLQSLSHPVDLNKVFTDITELSIPYLLCRQIMREHSEATSRRACGIEALNNNDESAEIRFMLPRVIGAGMYHEAHIYKG